MEAAPQRGVWSRAGDLAFSILGVALGLALFIAAGRHVFAPEMSAESAVPAQLAATATAMAPARPRSVAARPVKAARPAKSVHALAARAMAARAPSRSSTAAALPVRHTPQGGPNRTAVPRSAVARPRPKLGEQALTPRPRLRQRRLAPRSEPRRRPGRPRRPPLANVEPPLGYDTRPALLAAPAAAAVDPGGQPAPLPGISVQRRH